MPQEPLFEYFDMPLHGLVVSNREETDTEGQPQDEPELYNWH